MSEQGREPRGTPSGGQFAPSKNPESSLDLGLDNATRIPQRFVDVRGEVFSVLADKHPTDVPGRLETFLVTNNLIGGDRTVQIDRQFRCAFVERVDGFTNDEDEVDVEIARSLDDDVRVVAINRWDGGADLYHIEHSLITPISPKKAKGVAAAQSIMTKEGGEDRARALLLQRQIELNEIVQHARIHGLYARFSNQFRDAHEFVGGLELGLAIGVRPVQTPEE